MIDDKKVNYKLDAISKLINNLKLSISGNKDHDELDENNVIVNLDEISQKITDLHNMIQNEFDEFEAQHKNESDETQELLTNKLTGIFDNITLTKNTLGNKLDTINTTLQGVVGRINSNTSEINSLKNRVSNLENR